MGRPAYFYELLMTRADDTHGYAVFAPDAGQIGVTFSRWEGRQKRWTVEAWFAEPRNITRTFSTRATAADVMFAFWREWRAKLDLAQGRVGR